jgi:hypothetical protein
LFLYVQVSTLRHMCNFGKWNWAVLSINTMRVEVFKSNGLFLSFCDFRCMNFVFGIKQDTPPQKKKEGGGGRKDFLM